MGRFFLVVELHCKWSATKGAIPPNFKRNSTIYETDGNNAFACTNYAAVQWYRNKSVQQ